MNKLQLLQREQETAAAKAKQDDRLANLYLTCAPGFSAAFHQRPGMARRRALLAFFQQYPESRLSVNNKWQARTDDPDLQHLLKKGLLVRERDRGGRRHPKNRSSGKRQTYLVLA
ncbi:hypothetical protein [Burkholderia ambifaria]|uniref:hypothetical protein n=1 Tax=Burkholderia ambifaria TaxID=152480 RepID=UPI000F814B44|nr:hypothetical protein [Burkholderia ambifaria]